MRREGETLCWPEGRRYRCGEPPAKIDKKDRTREADDQQDRLKSPRRHLPSFFIGLQSPRRSEGIRSPQSLSNGAK
jgi:hypothetical protein